MHLMLFLFVTTLIVGLTNSYNRSAPLFGVPRAFAVDVQPLGVGVTLGAFVFGVGMQLSSGCGCGTLLGMGFGSVKACVTFAGLLIGCTVGVIDPIVDWFTALPKTNGAVKLPPIASLAIELVLFAGLFWFEFRRARQQEVDEPISEISLADAAALMVGGWDPDEEAKKRPTYRMRAFRNYFSTVALASCVGCWFLCTGGPIHVLEAFSLVGSYVCRGCGARPADWHFWHGPLPNPMKYDVFLSDVSLLLGAFVAAGCWGSFGQVQNISAAHLIAGFIGGLVMGLGGTIAHGCTLGAMTSGIDSSSLHGWLWFVSACMGSAIVVIIEKAMGRKQSEEEAYAAIE
jgi:uncharacterized membrane protein YedE/YeeE/Pyruvate/2-oxoacid:ferredoxin oxidoreductase delta subunit